MEKNKKQAITIAFCVLVFLWFLPVYAYAATLSVSPASSRYYVGDKVAVKIIVSSDTSLNAVAGSVSFPAMFSIESVSKAGSILNFWVTEPSFSKTNGTAQFEGVALSGFQGSNGVVITVNLRAIREGSGKITFQSGQILANDGQGTDITGALNSGSFVVEASKEVPVAEQSKEQAPEISLPSSATLDAPAIILGKKEQLLAVSGISEYPKSNVLLSFVSAEGSKVFITGMTDSKGGFSLIVPQALRNGSYSVNAVIVGENDVYSPVSNSLIIRIGGSFYNNEVWSIAAYFFSALMLLFAVFFLRTRHLEKDGGKDMLKSKVNQAINVSRKSFKILRQDCSQDQIDELKKDLSAAEEVIEKEIKNIR